MNRFRAWVFATPKRPARFALAILLVLTILMATFMFVRIASIGSPSKPPVAPAPSATPSTVTPPTTLPVVPRTTTPSVVVPTVRPTTQDPEDVLVGDDPTPVALSAAQDWLAGDAGALEKNLLPAALAEAMESPAPKGMRITSEAYLSAPGPTESVVVVPTNQGDLRVSCIVVNSERWMVESMGLDPGQQVGGQ